MNGWEEQFRQGNFSETLQTARITVSPSPRI